MLGLLGLGLAACGSGGGARDLLTTADGEVASTEVVPEVALDAPDLAEPDAPADEADAPGLAEPDAPDDAADATDAPDLAEPDAPDDAAEPLDTAEPADAPTEELASPPLATCDYPAGAQLANARLPLGYCAWTWASGLGNPRGITVAPDGDVLVVERAAAQVTVLYDGDGDGVSGTGERVVLAEAPGLNHGVVLNGGSLYASSATAVYRWAYPAGQRANLGAAQAVVQGIPGGGHVTRTLAFDDAGQLYVSVGSGSNVDSSSARARIRRFSAAQVATGGVDFADGQIFADGLRNEVGLVFDESGTLWGVENGVDNLARVDLGGDLHNGNPGEEVNRFAVAGAFYGYPYCWSEYALPAGVGGGPGTQWAHPTFVDDGVHTDAWCQDVGNVARPAFVMPPHVAPLDVLFYDGAAFPADARGDAFVSWHGSWNSDEPVGRKVVRLRVDAGGVPVAWEPLLEYVGPGDVASDWPHRPVGLALDAAGRLLVTSDATGVVIAVGYDAVGTHEPPLLLGTGGRAGVFGCAVPSRW